MGGFAGGTRAAEGFEAGEQAGVDGGGGFAVELLVDDGLGERLEGGLGGGEAHGEGAGAGDEGDKFGVGGGELGDGFGAVVGEVGSALGGAGHEGNDTAWAARRGGLFGPCSLNRRLVQAARSTCWGFMWPQEVSRAA